MKYANIIIIKFFFFFFIANSFLAFANEETNISQEAFKTGLAEIAYYETSHDHMLRYTHFKSPAKEVTGTVLLVQGRGTFLEFYETLIVPLLERNLDVWMYDLTGQGGSSRLLSLNYHDEETVRCMQHIDSFDLYVEDLNDFIQNVFLTEAKGNLFLGGYSTGGHIALRYLQCHLDNPFKSAFVISPLLAMNTSIPNYLLSAILWDASWFMHLEKYMPGDGHIDPIFITPFENNPYTSDEASYEEMKELCTAHMPFMMGKASIGWIKAASYSIRNLWANEAIKGIKIPVLIATGGKDTVVDVSYNERFANCLKKSMHVSYPEGRHELFREDAKIRSAWWEDFDTFQNNLQ